MTRRPTDAELDAIEDAARRADEARNDAEYEARLAKSWTVWQQWCGDLAAAREILRRNYAEIDPDEPVPHRSRWRPVAPAEEPRDG